MTHRVSSLVPFHSFKSFIFRYFLVEYSCFISVLILDSRCFQAYN